MASEPLDPRTFKSWEDAFQYPIPVVRKLEQQLRSNAGENREKLRSLVGASYRDLLDTAETIIDMEVRMQQVESKLSRVGHHCNSRNIERITRNATKSDTHARDRDVERYTFASQLSVLRNCPIVMTRLMKADRSYLLIAKVLVISRLLHKALSQAKQKPPIVDQLRDKLGTLRRRLLRRIDKRLASDDGDTETLLESMSAYSLATSSTPTDVLRHFHHVRMERITGSLRTGQELKQHGISALKLCLQTCQQTQVIFPRRLADALAKLKAQPLVRDPEVCALHELNLDIHDRWIGEEARNYTPWPRHDELQRAEAERLLHQWSKQAISAFLTGIETALEQAQDLKEVAELRQELIETWIISGSRMAGVKSSNVLDDLRDVMNGQLENIVRSRTQSLRGVVDDVTETLAAWEEPKTVLCLWSTGSTTTALSKGAQAFKQTILNTHQGRDDAVIRVVDTYEKWMASVLKVKGIAKAMKETRWDDPFTDEVEFSGEEDDEFGGDSKQMLLSDEDPRLLEEVTQDALSSALSLLSKSFAKIVEDVTGDEEGKDMVSRTILLLRVIREIGDRTPRLRINDKSTEMKTPFTNEILNPLHTKLAAQIARPAVEEYRKHLLSSTKSKSRSHILWEGNPPLPAQPSPSAFRFLHSLVKSMESQGSDLWAPQGVQILKSTLREHSLEIWREGLDAIQKFEFPAPESISDAEHADEAGEDGHINQDPAPPDAEEIKVEKLKLLLFDVLYIHRHLYTLEDSAPVDQFVEEVRGGAGVDNSGLTRLKKNAGDYGRKTYLLFALLA